ncbi:MAG: hypothetical protein HY736_17430 [Verrucomicrobia bacterium]|nr:hypothetical protein [Verrucomicrobiota bacterium]
MKTLRHFLLLSSLVATLPLLRAKTVIYPVEAIDDLWTLAAEDFRQRYGGINITGLGPNDEGWYVRYRHENLTYLFGPVSDREEARRKKWEMEAVRDAAIRNRPTLSSSLVDFVRFTYSGAYGKAGNSPYGGAGAARISNDGKSGPDGDMDGDGIPNSKDDDMDGDGISNAQDTDMDGDGIANEKDDYMYGADPAKGGANGEGGLAKDGSEKGGAGKDGSGLAGGDGDKQGSGEGAKLAGLGDGDQAGGQTGSKGGQQGMQSGDGTSAGSAGGQQGTAGQKGRQVASNQRGGQQGSQSGQSGQQSGQSGQQSGQSGQQSGQQQGGGGSSGQAGQPGQPGQPSQGSSGNPINLLAALLRLVLGL